MHNLKYLTIEEIEGIKNSFTIQYNLRNLHHMNYYELLGKKLQQGDLIGYVGQTGLASGPHLDFRVYKNGKAIDPLKLKSPSAEPVDPSNIQAYFRQRDILYRALHPLKKDGKSE